MRVITGSARGMRLASPDGPDTRPTADRVKEAVFSMIQFETEGRRALDLFAGSGQMGIEALSRGAERAVLVESDRRAAELIRANLEKTGLAGKAAVMNTDALMFLQSGTELFDIVFMDPPYGRGLIERALPLAAARMSPGGVIICELPAREAAPPAAGEFKLTKQNRYGRTAIAVYRIS